MDTERTLDRQIADALKLRSVPYESRFKGFKVVGVQLVDEQGESWVVQDNDDQLWKNVPKFSTDLNAAIRLVKLMPLGAVGIEEDGVKWFCSAYMDGAGTLAYETADTPAMAICLAWLAYTAR